VAARLPAARGRVPGFTIYKNLKGTSAPYSHFPWHVLAWLGVGLLVVLLAPHVARRIGERLTSELETR
jgi:hypothetical protein